MEEEEEEKRFGAPFDLRMFGEARYSVEKQLMKIILKLHREGLDATEIANRIFKPLSLPRQVRYLLNKALKEEEAGTLKLT